jgi:hypothetical protein
MARPPVGPVAPQDGVGKAKVKRACRDGLGQRWMQAGHVEPVAAEDAMVLGDAELSAELARYERLAQRVRDEE